VLRAMPVTAETATIPPRPAASASLAASPALLCIDSGFFSCVSTRRRILFFRFCYFVSGPDERDAAYRAYVERVCSAWKDAPPTSPSELLLAPGRTLVRHQPDPGRVPTETPSDPPPGMVPTRRLTSFERY
jgi:hypothetical protein